ncbi:stalk domain-containing protein [Effusibacillus consociatus]|uniref:Stalk domain-containing protein n=1 Tax=Effusibacillus consociatus TaxID=1117041 RepID=A0ABV9Q6B0_9BACL
MFDGQPYVKVRDVADALGFGVSWDENSSKVKITKTTLEQVPVTTEIARVKPKIIQNTPNSSGIEGDLQLGILSAKYESNGDPGVIGNTPGDPGGKSYGAYQLASNMGRVDDFLKWLSGVNYGYWEKLHEARKRDGWTLGENFDKVWRQLAQNDREGFLALQHGYIKYSHYDVAAKILKDRYGFDISTRSNALKNVLWSVAVQHGPGIVEDFFGNVDLKHMNDRQIITAVYDERMKVEIYFRSSSPSVKRAVYNRFVNEKADALKMLESE